MAHPFLELFEPILASRTSDEAVGYLLKHPVLTSPYYTALLTDWAGTLGSLERQKAERMIQLKLGTFQLMRQGKLRVDLPNPLLDLAQKVTDGKFTLRHAQLIASQPEFFVELMYPRVTSYCDVVENVMAEDWRSAVTMMKILLSALDARRNRIPELQQSLELTSVESWIAVARRACFDVPDGRLFRDAVTRGDALADLDSGSDPPAAILHRLGVLHLDPYVTRRIGSDLDQELRDWRFRLLEEYGEQLDGVPAAELEMPSIDEALPRAVSYFRRAAARRTGEARGRTLKALVQALNWHKTRGLSFDPEECKSLAREALGLLPFQKFPAEHAVLTQTLEDYGSIRGKTTSETIAIARTVLETPVETWITRNQEGPERGPREARARASYKLLLAHLDLRLNWKWVETSGGGLNLNLGWHWRPRDRRESLMIFSNNRRRT